MKKVITDPSYRAAFSKWLQDRIKFYGSDAQFVGLMEDGKILAVVAYNYFNGASVHVHIAAEGTDWLNMGFRWYCFHYPFNELGVKKIISPTSSTNKKALRFAKHLGFKKEATIKDAHPDGDIILLTMTPEECKYLEKEEGNPLVKLNIKGT